MPKSKVTVPGGCGVRNIGKIKVSVLLIQNEVVSHETANHSDYTFIGRLFQKEIIIGQKLAGDVGISGFFDLIRPAYIFQLNVVDLADLFFRIINLFCCVGILDNRVTATTNLFNAEINLVSSHLLLVDPGAASP